MAFPRVCPMGDAALLVELGDRIDLATNARVHALARRLDARQTDEQPAGQAADLRAISSLTPGYTSLLVTYDPARAGADELTASILRLLDALPTVPPRFTAHPIEIPTRYGGEFGPDLEFVARFHGISPQDVIRIHTGATYQVFMIGFVPGYPYLGIVPAAIAVPRLETPRRAVPAGSVGLAGQQTGIYPRASPGGWRIIGRTDPQLFDPTRDPPARLRAGDQVRFVDIEAA